ncbi:hypothetical protein [Streptomyces sp. NPDC059909]|uniref:hypothetical protein n=1 Tax=Streptomyces sp. NPDC059909 TaxID=3346998 RepID=UPI00364D976F
MGVDPLIELRDVNKHHGQVHVLLNFSRRICDGTRDPGRLDYDVPFIPVMTVALPIRTGMRSP